MDDPESFIGRTVVQHDFSDERRFARLAATLDHDTFFGSATAVPPLGHWLCFLPTERQSMIGLDGHPTRTKDGLLPDVGLPRRMWAGSRIRFLQDLPLNVSIERTSTLTAATPKSGRSGRMLFVTVEHRVSVTGEDVAIVEEQDIVYREAATSGSSFVRTAADPGDSDPTISIVTPDPILLFRYSALTFNAHRIHYDRQYAGDEEGYPGLVVQGPLIATLMLDHLLRHSKSRIERYSFRAASPAFAGEPIALGLRSVGEKAQLRAVASVGVLMTGTAELKP